MFNTMQVYTLKFIFQFNYDHDTSICDKSHPRYAIMWYIRGFEFLFMICMHKYTSKSWIIFSLISVWSLVQQQQQQQQQQQ